MANEGGFVNIQDWLPLPPWEGLPLPAFLSIYWPWYKRGFTLKLVSPPAGAVLWNANFAEKSFDYAPLADSGWLGVDEVWEYPSDPLGCTTLRVWMLDAENSALLDIGNLGPINSGKDYIFDCSTETLREV